MTQRKINHIAYAKLFKFLLQSIGTSHEMAEETGLHIATVRPLLNIFRKYGVVHIVGWIPDFLDRDMTPVYKLGEGRDKARRRLSASERQKRYRARKRAKKQQLELLDVFRNPTSEVA